nr:MAG TPA: hypothetical protein [Caudoviricetes sp.]
MTKRVRHEFCRAFFISSYNPKSNYNSKAPLSC